MVVVAGASGPCSSSMGESGAKRLIPPYRDPCPTKAKGLIFGIPTFEKMKIKVCRVKSDI